MFDTLSRSKTEFQQR